MNDEYYQNIDFSNINIIESKNQQQNTNSNQVNLIEDLDKEYDQQLQFDNDQLENEEITEEQKKYLNTVQEISEDSDEEEEVQKSKQNFYQPDKQIPENDSILKEVQKLKDIQTELQIQLKIQSQQQQKQQQQLEQVQKQNLLKQQQEEQNCQTQQIIQNEKQANRNRRKQRNNQRNKSNQQMETATINDDVDDQDLGIQNLNINEDIEKVNKDENQEIKNQQNNNTKKIDKNIKYQKRYLVPIARPDPNFQIDKMQIFLTNPLPQGYLLQTSIRREKSGFSKIYPKYHVYMQHNFQYLMSCKKRSGNKTSNYLIGMNQKKLDKNDPGFLGKVRSNFMGTEFQVYDTGENPNNAKSIQNIRRELATILYDNQKSDNIKDPTRKMRVLIPDVNDETLQQVIFKPAYDCDTMIGRYQEGSLNGMRYYHNKSPKYNREMNAFVLDFNGRVDKPSVKNFQLIDYINEDNVYLLFGKVGDDIFTMDAQYPLSPLQAFGICISSFDYKFACE